MGISDVSAELIIGGFLAVWSMIWTFHKVVARRDFVKVEDEIEEVKKQVNSNSDDLKDIGDQMNSTNLTLVEIKANSKYVYDTVKEMKTDTKKDINDLYDKIEALLKK